MRFNLLASIVFALAIPACGGGDDGGDDTSGDDTADDTGDDSGDDTSGQPDAPPATAAVESVTCPAEGTEDALVITMNSMFVPMTTTITVDEIVRFETEGSHNVESTTSGEDFGVGFGQVGCFRFTEAGDYTFRCAPHGFTGTVVVE
jgi:plastocyanin